MDIEKLESMIKEDLIELEKEFANQPPAVLKQIKETFLEKVRDTVLEEQSKILESVKHELEDYSRIKNELEGTLIMVEQLEEKFKNGEE
jgi:hypothetical protein